MKCCFATKNLPSRKIKIFRATFQLQYSRLARYSLRDTPYCASAFRSLHRPPDAVTNAPFKGRLRYTATLLLYGALLELVKIEGIKLLYWVPLFEERLTIACDGGEFLTRALERHFTEGETAPNFPQPLYKGRTMDKRKPLPMNHDLKEYAVKMRKNQTK